MKRLLCIVAGLFVSLNLAYANDLLFKASNGALNQNSVGVKKLTDKEMAQVKGGLNIGAYKDTAYRNSSGQTIYALFWRLTMTDYEIKNAVIYLDDTKNGYEAYQNCTSFINFARNGDVVVEVRYNMSTRQSQFYFASMTSSNQLYYNVSRFANSIINSARNAGIEDYTKHYSSIRAQRYLR